jgi:putative membrane protein
VYIPFGQFQIFSYFVLCLALKKAGEIMAEEAKRVRTSQKTERAQTIKVLKFQENSPTLDSDQLALIRTSLAYDRTLLAWVRTSIGIIGFGLTFYKFFEYLGENEKYVPHYRLLGPRGYAIILIICGEMALLTATVDYYRAKKSIKLFSQNLIPSRVPWVAIFVVTFGFVSLIAALLGF